MNFTGHGYDEDFTSHMEALIASLSAEPDTAVRLVKCADAVCSACPNLRGGECVTAEKVRALDEGWLAETGLCAQAALTWRELRDIYAPRVTPEAVERVCERCQWRTLCASTLEERQKP